MCGAIQWAYAAAALAIQHAALSKEATPAERFGVVLGSELLFGELEEVQTAFRASGAHRPGTLEHWSETAFKELFPLWMLKYLPNMLACHVSIMHNAQGPNNTITESDVASLLALGEACRIICRDQADRPPPKLASAI